MSEFKPLLPDEAFIAPLMERASDLSRAGKALGSVCGQVAQLELQALLRSMNAYYTHRVEGERIRPRDIARALAQDLSTNTDLAPKQRLAVAHNRLAQTDVTRSDGTQMVPAQLRERGVVVGRHEAPARQSLPRFLGRRSQVCADARRGEASIVTLAAAHHRLTWMHPLLDGNGRVACLHTHFLLRAGGQTSGMWSPLRGFARTESRYEGLLEAVLDTNALWPEAEQDEALLRAEQGVLRPSSRPAGRPRTRRRR